MRTTAIVLLALIGGLTLPVNLHADGKEIFEKNCKTCHGPDAKGVAAMATAFRVDAGAMDLTDAATKGKADADLAKIVSDGQGKMPPFGKKLSADDIKGVVSYLKGL